MSTFFRTTALAALLSIGSGATPATAQQNFDDVEIESTDLGNGLYMLMGAGGNIGASVGEDGIILIDDQFAPLTDRILAALAKLSDQPVRYVINTHWHWDHSGGNENMGKAGAVIVAHDNVRVRMASEQVMKAIDRTVPPSPGGALPVITFSDSATLHFNGLAAHAFHIPGGHTDGDAVIRFQGANVVHTGDIYFKGRAPFIDYDSGGSLAGLIVSAGAVLALTDDETRIIPGHGPLANRADLADYVGKLEALNGRLTEMVEGGMTAEQVVEADPIAELFGDAWGAPDGYGFFIRVVASQMIAAME